MKIQKKKVISVVVDCQNDFIKSDGKLVISGAEEIIPNLTKVVKHFHKIRVPQIFTMDAHFADSEELSSEPNFRTTFPEHCIVQSLGADLINEIKDIIQGNFQICNWFDSFSQEELEAIAKHHSICITKDKFDVFSGNEFTNNILDIIQPDVAYVCGVATNVCVDFAIKGLLQRGIEVRAITDCMKELDTLPLEDTLNNWTAHGVSLIKSLGIRS